MWSRLNYCDFYPKHGQTASLPMFLLKYKQSVFSKRVRMNYYLLSSEVLLLKYKHLISSISG
ncbi:hypothetical protein OKW21_001351 [Catalinimonas alkaloidigena]|nr:hypothetical protein [Catalinimonas alkaloidigena]